MRLSTFPRSGVLILGTNSIQSLVPSTLISQVESLLDSHRIEDAIQLADQQRRKLQKSISVNEDEADELHYVYQRIGFQCFTETLFEDAGKCLFNGNVDPGLLVSYFPDLRGSLFSPEDSTDVFAGVAEHMPTEASVDDIIRNYSPHLPPNTRSAPPTAELRKILGMAAEDMLEIFMRRCRMKQKSAVEKTTPNAIVDTVLAKLFAQREKTADLYALIQEPNSIHLSEIEPVLKRTGQYNALCMIYKGRGDDLKLLDIWSKLIEGEWTDEEIVDPLSQMIALLTEKRDRTLTQQWGIWLVKRDPDRALKLLMSRDSGKRRDRPEDDLLLLQQIREADLSAGGQFLEYLVLQRRSTSPDLHMQLASTCIEQLLACLKDESTSKLWRAKAASYASSRSNTSFLSYFASTTPESEHKRVRLKTALFLQGSTLYDPETIRSRLVERPKILALELSIVDGRLGNHRAALATLVHELGDATSAEAYCTLGGNVVPGKTAQSIAEKYGLQDWANALFASTSKSASTKARPIPMGSQKTVDENLKKELLKILLEVYMSDGKSSRDRAAHLLNSQAVNLDVLDVISLVPSNWPVEMMSSFLARSFRRTLHAKHEGQIIKTISAGQNLEVKDRTWLILREQGAIVEEALEGDEDEDASGGSYDEKNAMAEKVALHLTPHAASDNGKQEVHWVPDTESDSTQIT